MSIKVMSSVWEKAEVKGSKLLLLLALADFANDDGICWPRIDTLAKKIRMSDRHTIRLIQQLEVDKQIEIKRQSSNGMKANNIYRLAKIYRSDKMSLRSDIAMSPNHVTSMSHKPSYNRQKDKKNFSTKEISGVVK